ncbi:MAG: hypothetical protein BV456_04825 [Thermoplasmata archaeon M8B2D]|nr:MAG: hypothetical protein BV456_04825 [Thermoplasmata archaeon M8B2D]
MKFSITTEQDLFLGDLYFKRINNRLYRGQSTIEGAIICGVVSRDDLSIEEELEFFPDRSIVFSTNILNISNISIDNIKKDYPELFI